MNWNFFVLTALCLLSGYHALKQALNASGIAPDRPRRPVAAARTKSERAWRDQPVQTFLWQLQAARYSQPPFRRP